MPAPDPPPAAAPPAAAADGAAAAVALVPAPAPAHRAARYNAGYDLVLADGKKKIRVVLAASLNPMVDQGAIRRGTAMRVEEWVYPRYNELVMGGGDPLVIVTALAPYAEPVALHDDGSVGDLSWAFASHEKVRPLVGHRAYYLSAHDDTLPYGGRWESGAAAPEDDSDSDDDVATWRWDGNGRMEVEDIEESGEFVTIAQSLDMTNGFHHESRPLADGFDEAQAVAARKRKRVRTPGSAQPIYGVVVKKSGLTHYGTIDKAGKCPFHFHVIVQDQTRSAVMVTIWTTAACAYFQRLQVGDPIAVCKYRESTNAPLAL